MQPNPSLPQEPQAQPPEPQIELSATTTKASPRKFNIKIVFLVLLILAVAALGFWTYQLSTDLKMSQQSLSTLQGNYDDLTAENGRVTTEFGQVSSELESTNTELTTTSETLKTVKSDLSKAKQEASALQSKMSKVGGYVEIMRGVFKDKDTILETYLKTIITQDKKLGELYLAYMNSKSSVDLFNWTAYLISKSVELLKQ